jgi:hypothetical protein
MKYVKTLGLAAVAALALMALVGAGTASAKEGVLCSTASDPCNSKWAVGTVIDFSLEKGTSASLTDTNGNTLDTCTESTVKGVLKANPDGTGTATGENTTVDWGNCSFTTNTLVPGALRIEAEDNNGNGWLYADSTIEVTINIGFLGDCRYGVEAGTLLGTVKEGKAKEATFTANASAKLLGGCFGPSTSLWKASYILTEPTNTTLWVSHK